MPLIGSGMHPGGFVFGCLSQHGVRDDEVILCALVQWQEAVVVYLTNAVSAEHPIPPIVVSKQTKVIAGRDRVQNGTEVGVRRTARLFPLSSLGWVRMH